MAYFRAQGLVMEPVDATALSVLARALTANFFTHNLTVEQISAFCQKFFGDFPRQESDYTALVPV